MTTPALAIGLRHKASLPITDKLTVPSMADRFPDFADMPPVFSTAYMVAYMEWVCIEAMKPFMAAGQKSVGTHVNVSHAAATPVGMTVTIEVELIAIEGKMLTFKVTGRDDTDIICEGTHGRFIIDAAKFSARVAQKAAKA